MSGPFLGRWFGDQGQVAQRPQQREAIQPAKSDANETLGHTDREPIAAFGMEGGKNHKEAFTEARGQDQERDPGQHGRDLFDPPVEQDHEGNDKAAEKDDEAQRPPGLMLCSAKDKADLLWQIPVPDDKVR